MHLHTFALTHICTYTHLHVHTFALVHICTYTHLHLHTFALTHICTYTHLHLHTFALTHICFYTHLHLHTFTEILQLLPFIIFVFHSMYCRYFRHEENFGLSCFALKCVNNKEERGARMKSVGIICKTYTSLHEHQEFLEQQVR